MGHLSRSAVLLLVVGALASVPAIASKPVVKKTKPAVSNKSASDAAFSKGEDLESIRQYKKATARYTTAIRLRPGYAEAYNRRGICYDGLKQYSKAIADYNKALALDAKSASPFFNRGNTYLTLNRERQGALRFNGCDRD